MKSNWMLAVVVLLLVVIGFQFYNHYRQDRRIERLEASLRSSLPSGKASPTPGSGVNPPANGNNPDPFGSFPQDPFGFDTDPFDDMEKMRQKMDQILGSALGGSDWFSMRPPLNTSLYPDNPKIEIADESDRFVITVTQVDPDSQNIEANIDGRQLTLTFTTKHTSEERRSDDSGSLSGFARSSRQFTKSVQLPAPVDVSSMQTQIKDDRILITVKKSGT